MQRGVLVTQLLRRQSSEINVFLQELGSNIGVEKPLLLLRAHGTLITAAAHNILVLHPHVFLQHLLRIVFRAQCVYVGRSRHAAGHGGISAAPDYTATVHDVHGAALVHSFAAQGPHRHLSTLEAAGLLYGLDAPLDIHSGPHINRASFLLE